MQARYLDCSMFGSYWIDCIIHEKRAFDVDLDADPSYKIIYPHHPHPSRGSMGFVISFHCNVEEQNVTKWVNKEFVELPSFAEYGAM